MERPSTRPQGPAPLDFGPLAAPVSPFEAHAALRHFRAVGAIPYGYSAAGARLVRLVAAVLLGLALLCAGFFLLATMATLLLAEYRAALFNAGVFAAILVGTAVASWFALRRRMAVPARWWRMGSFAQANGFKFAPSAPPPAAGLLFEAPATGEVLDAFEAPLGTTTAVVGNFCFRKWDMSDGTMRCRGFVALALATAPPAPALLLPKGFPWPAAERWSRRGAWAEVEWQPGRRDGPRLFFPRGQEAASRAAFTAELVAAMADFPFPLAAEFNERWLLVYAHRAFDLDDRRCWEPLWQFLHRAGPATGGPPDPNEGWHEILGIGAAGSRLRLDIAREGGWQFRARIGVEAGPWSGTLATMFVEEELRRFAAALRRTDLPRLACLGGGRSTELVLAVEAQRGGPSGALAVTVELAWSGDDPYPFLRWLIFDVSPAFAARAADAIEECL